MKDERLKGCKVHACACQKGGIVLQSPDRIPVKNEQSAHSKRFFESFP